MAVRPWSTSPVSSFTLCNGERPSRRSPQCTGSTRTRFWPRTTCPTRTPSWSGKKLNILSIPGAIHTVKRGESLWEIARTYQTDMNEIVAFNELENPNRIRPSQELVIPGARAASIGSAIRSERLISADGRLLRAFELAGHGQEFHPATAPGGGGCTTVSTSPSTQARRSERRARESQLTGMERRVRELGHHRSRQQYRDPVCPSVTNHRQGRTIRQPRHVDRL